MDTLATPQPLVDVQQGDWVIREHPHPYSNCALVEPIRRLYRVSKRTPSLIWLGGYRYRLSGIPVDGWARDSLRPPYPREVEELQEQERRRHESMKESAHEHAANRERYISLMYQAARSHDRELFVELLGPWEVGDWDDKLAKLDEIDATTRG